MKASEKFNMQHPLSISLESSGFSEKMVTLEQEQYLISSCKELTFYRDEAYETGQNLGRQTVSAKGRKQYLRKSRVMGSIIMAYQRNSFGTYTCKL